MRKTNVSLFLSSLLIGRTSYAFIPILMPIAATVLAMMRMLTDWAIRSVSSRYRATGGTPRGDILIFRRAVVTVRH